MTDVPVVSLGDGVEMPMVGFGTWRLSGQLAREAAGLALRAGYRHIDTATMYRNEAEIGAAAAESGLRREELFLTTKLPAASAGRERETLTASLRALGTDYVDLWLVHWPPDGDGALESVWRRFTELRDEGLCRAIGVSNYSLAQIDRVTKATGVPPAVNQVVWSPADHDPALLAGLGDRGVVTEGYSSLKRTRLDAPGLAAIAAAHEVTPAQVVLRWHLQLGITVIPKSSRRDRIERNLRLTGFTLTPGEMDTLGGGGFLVE